MEKALVYNIQKFCVHDGPGIRTTVFFKGCPLHCDWCHNPESQGYGPETLFDPDKCTGCGRCAEKCPSRAVTVREGKAKLDAGRCTLCGECVDFCPAGAREIAGQEYAADALLAEIVKDRPFYEQSGGGVTFSGGEATAQIDCLEQLARRCREQGIAVALDTCGYAPFASFERLLPYVDVFLYDIKLMDSAAHKAHTGKDNALILENLARLAAAGANVNLRLPLIAGVNADPEHVGAVIGHIAGMNISQVNLLPYHDIGRGKYKKLGRACRGREMSRPDQELLEQFKMMFEQANYKTKIGG